MVAKCVKKFKGNAQVALSGAQLYLRLELSMKIGAAGNYKPVPASEIEIMFLLGG